MVLVSSLVKLARSFPPIKVKAQRIQKVFYDMGIVLDARRWVSCCLILSILSLGILYFYPFYGLTSIILLAVVYFLPYFELNSLKRDIEAEMPIFLRQMGSLLKMGIPFTTALSVVSKEGELSKHMGFVIREIERGVSIPKALLDFAEKLGTETTKRAMAQIISVYEHGGGDELKRLGDELLNAQRHKIKEYAAKSSMVALFFVIVAVVGPTFYIVASLITSGFSGQATTLDITSAALAMDLIIPVISLFIVLLGVGMFPPVLFAKKELSLTTVFISIPLAIIFFLPITLFYRWLILAVVFVFSAYKFFGEFIKRRRLDELELKLGDALLVASTLPKGVHMKELFAKLCRESLGTISKEFCIAKRQFDNNMNITNIMQDLRDRVPSKLFARVIEVLEYAFKSGRNVGEKISELAEDILMFSELKREQMSLLAIQKYSLLLGMVLVPVIIASAISIVGGLNVVDKQGLEGLKSSVIPAYFILMSALTSTFITSIEGKRTSELIYFSALSLITLFLYFNVHLAVGV